MYIYKDPNEGWFFDFGIKKIFFELNDRILIKVDEWITCKVISITFNDDIDYITCDIGMEKQDIQNIPFQFIEDARN